MWFGILKWAASFVTGPIFDDLLKGYQAKLAAGTSHDTLAAGLATTELQLQMREMELQTQLRIAEIGHWYEPDKIMGYTAAILFAKIVIWDICLGLGTTTLHDGWATQTATAIVVSYFGKRGVENVMKIWKK